MVSQGLLFSEPSIAETGVWCELSQGVDPAEWASLCRYIGKLSPREFGRVRALVMGSSSRGKRLADDRQRFGRVVPVVSVGPSGVGGEYQREVS
jgi:hypothetical protein